MTIGLIEFKRLNTIPVPIGKETGAATLANWLASDIQYSLTTVKEWLELLRKIAKGVHKGGYQGTGNAFSVYAQTAYVFIEGEYSENLKVCISVEKAIQALLQYKAFLQSEFRDLKFTPASFEIEYVAEGSPAKQFYLANGGIL